MTLRGLQDLMPVAFNNELLIRTPSMTTQKHFQAAFRYSWHHRLIGLQSHIMQQRRSLCPFESSAIPVPWASTWPQKWQELGDNSHSKLGLGWFFIWLVPIRTYLRMQTSGGKFDWLQDPIITHNPAFGAKSVIGMVSAHGCNENASCPCSPVWRPN